MSLYKQWTDMVVDYVKLNGEAKFWKEYSSVEEKIYAKILGEKKTNLTGKVEDLAKEFNTDILFFMGFLDGLSESVDVTMDIENMEADTELNVNIDLEKLYFNMLDAKADYLYNLQQWESIFSLEKRKEIHTEWKNGKTVVNETKIGRNDPCPCGSGKKYKKCCGK